MLDFSESRSYHRSKYLRCRGDGSGLDNAVSCKGCDIIFAGAISALSSRFSRSRLFSSHISLGNQLTIGSDGGSKGLDVCQNLYECSFLVSSNRLSGRSPIDSQCDGFANSAWSGGRRDFHRR